MLKQLPRVISGAEIARLRALLDAGEWRDGNVTSGPQAARAKRNLQMRTDVGGGAEASALVLASLSRDPRFLTAALPSKIVPPLFNQYGVGDGFGHHIDNAIRAIGAAGDLIRTDLSATLFLSDASEYDGGELVIESAAGATEVKLAAGDLVLYPARSVHWVKPITRGVRLASFFWIQSLIREDSARELLEELDESIQNLGRVHGAEHPDVRKLLHVYHGLVGRWAET